MAIVAKESSGAKFELCPIGSHVARCYRMVELGTCNENFGTESKTRNKIWLDFETPLETFVFDEAKGAQPFSVSKEYALSFGVHPQTGQKATLRSHLEGWRGKNYTEEEAKQGVDVSKLVGQPCMIAVGHKETKSGNKYNEITGISKLTKGLTCPPAVNPLQVLSYDAWDQNIFDSLPSFIQEKMKTTPEYKQLFGSNSASVNQPLASSVGVSTDDEDGLPF